MFIRRALRTLAVTVTAGVLTLTTAVASNAAMSEEMAAQAAARMKEMAGHVAAWQAANPGKTFTNDQLQAAFPPAPAGPGVIHVGLASAAPGYCFMAADSTAVVNPDDPLAALADSRFLESTTAEVFIPAFDLVFGESPRPACAAAIRNLADEAKTPEQKAADALVTNPTPFHASLVPPPPAAPAPTPAPAPAPAPAPVVDSAAVRAGMVKDVKKAKRLIKKAQKKKAKARPTLKQLRKAGLKPSERTKVTVKYVKAKPKLHCVRAVNPRAGLKKRQAVWFDSGLKKVVTGAKPKGKRSACAKLM